jgi:hypothetical protein
VTAIQEATTVTRIEVSRDILAEPSSVALVLAGPAARELWPRRGDRRVGLVGSSQPRFAVDVDPPARSSLGFSAGVRVRAADEVVAAGRLSIRPGGDGRCSIDVSLAVDDDVADPVRRDALRYVANVAAVSRARSSAA